MIHRYIDNGERYVSKTCTKPSTVKQQARDRYIEKHQGTKVKINVMLCSVMFGYSQCNKCNDLMFARQSWGGDQLSNGQSV